MACRRPLPSNHTAVSWISRHVVQCHIAVILRSSFESSRLSPRTTLHVQSAPACASMMLAFMAIPESMSLRILLRVSEPHNKLSCLKLSPTATSYNRSTFTTSTIRIPLQRHVCLKSRNIQLGGKSQLDVYSLLHNQLLLMHLGIISWFAQADRKRRSDTA
jgi:hypothetical protein